jgi:hypothetical protein
MRARSTIWLCLLTTLGLGAAGRAIGQYAMLPSLFPEGVPGFDAEPGVTVMSRLHPELMPLGIRYGALHLFPTLDETMGYNSNVLGNATSGGQRGSWQVTTAPSLAVGTDWSRNQVGAVVNLQNTQYFSMPNQTQTNGSAAAGARLDLGQDQLTLALAHSSQHENLAAINAIASSQPISLQLDDARASYTLVKGRWNLTTGLEASNWAYGDATIAGQPSSQSYRDRIVGQGAMTLRYEWAPLRNVLFVMRALSQDYTRIPTGQPTTNSQGYQILGGLDYDDNGVWRWRMLLGGEVREFTASVYRPRNTVIAEAEATWFPSEMTTLRATLSRDTEDAAQEGVSGLIYTAGRLTIDHELTRQVLLRAYAGVQQADYFGGGEQTGYTAGVGVLWTLNRNLRLSLTYDQSVLRGGQATTPTPTSPTALATGYNQGLSLLTLHVGL